MITPRTFLILMVCLLGCTGLVSAQTGTVKGRVVDVEGKGVVGASIQDLVSQRGVTSGFPNGQFEIDSFSAGPHTLIVSCIGFVRQRLPVDVVADSVLNVDICLYKLFMWIEDDCYIPPGSRKTSPGRSTLNGYVREENGSGPLRGAGISLAIDFIDTSGMGHSCCCLSAKGNENGHYTMFDVAPGYRTLFVYASGFRLAVRQIIVPPDTTLTFDFELGHKTARDSLLPGFAAGRVWDAKQRCPVPGVTVSDLEEGAFVTSDADGAYRLTNLSPGGHTLMFTAAGYLSGQYPVNVSVAGSHENILLQPSPAFAGTGTISGRVMDKHGMGIAGADVQSKAARHHAVADTSGRFSLIGLTRGRDTLRVTCAGYWPDSLAVFLPSDRDTAVDLSMRTMELISIEDAIGYSPRGSGSTRYPTAPGHSIILGGARDNSTKKPIPFAVIEMRYDYHDTTDVWHQVCCFSLSADSLGKFAFDDLIPAHYQLSASDESHEYRLTSREVTTAADSTYTVNFDLEKDSTKH
jgi:hypothetical protein